MSGMASVERYLEDDQRAETRLQVVAGGHGRRLIEGALTRILTANTVGPPMELDEAVDLVLYVLDGCVVHDSDVLRLVDVEVERLESKLRHPSFDDETRARIDARGGSSCVL